jgi:hypothetical protein
MEEKEFCAELSWGWGWLCLAPLLASRAVRGYPTLTLRPRAECASKQAGSQSKQADMSATRAGESDNVYAALERYDWDGDVEFQSGLSAILGSNSSSEQAAELALRARCFYYARCVSRAP